MDCNAIGDYLRSNHHTRSTADLSKQLEAAFSCKGSEIRKCINRLRSDGIPICSCVDGYSYSDEPEDISGTINQLHGRIEKIERALHGMGKCISPERRMLNAEKN